MQHGCTNKIVSNILYTDSIAIRMARLLFPYQKDKSNLAMWDYADSQYFVSLMIKYQSWSPSCQ